MPEPRYFSIPSTVVGAVAFRNEALNWTPCVRSLTQDPLAWTNSPAEIIAAWPTRVMRSRWPRALTRRTQNPFSEFWNVTRSTSPAKTSVGVLALGACGIRVRWRLSSWDATGIKPAQRVRRAVRLADAI